MKASDRGILIGMVVLGVLAAFWFLVLSPKRHEAADLDAQITSLQAEVDSQEALVSSGRLARDDYQRNYSSLVVLGKAAPADGDTPSLLEQLIDISDRSKTTFSSLSLGTAPDAAAAPSAPAADTTAATTPAEPASSSTAQPVAEPTAVPTEASVAATLPIGATIGSAGLGVLPYDMEFSGDFFQIADLFKGIDDLVGSKAAKVDVGGRLITVNGFKMTKADATSPLDVELSISSYVLPESQGLTAGGTSTMPPASVPAATPTPVSEPTP
jgi:hypothetical protein